MLPPDWRSKEQEEPPAADPADPTRLCSSTKSHCGQHCMCFWVHNDGVCCWCGDINAELPGGGL